VGALFSAVMKVLLDDEFYRRGRPPCLPCFVEHIGPHLHAMIMILGAALVGALSLGIRRSSPAHDDNCYRGVLCGARIRVDTEVHPYT
jgi:hypothetical protein